MSETKWNKERIRNKTLLIVEGNHEKDKFITRLLEAFPEINIDIDNVIVFKTNIYILLSKIQNEYGDDWYEQDINLPLLISEEMENDIKYDKRDFTDIFLIFDYERHDPNFTEDGILRMQMYFSNSEDVGKLYLNYPMIESYMDLDNIVDFNYSNKKVSTNVRNGNEYKISVKNKIVSKLIYFPIKIKSIMIEKFGVEYLTAENCVKMLLSETDIVKAINNMKRMIGNAIHESSLKTLMRQTEFMILDYGFMENGFNYNTYMRYVFSQITIQNVKKSNFIQNGKYEIPNELLKHTYHEIDPTEILKQQNLISSPDGSHEVFVLNTSIFMLPDYNTELVFS